MKIIRTVTEERVTEGNVSAKPKWKIGDSVKIYAGPREDQIVTILDVRYRDELRHGMGPHFEYQCGSRWAGDGPWYVESNLVDPGNRDGWHYDRQGYCDNPGRGY